VYFLPLVRDYTIRKQISVRQTTFLYIVLLFRHARRWIVVGAALSAIHDSVNTPWTVESLAEAAGMSRSAFAARFKELLGQTPLEYVTEWRMQKAMQLVQWRDKKLIDVARAVGYESDAAFSKAFKRVVGANSGEYLKRGFEGHGHPGMAEDF
jgi:AraC-like DNA-binding protein